MLALRADRPAVRSVAAVCCGQVFAGAGLAGVGHQPVGAAARRARARRRTRAQRWPRTCRAYADSSRASALAQRTGSMVIIAAWRGSALEVTSSQPPGARSRKRAASWCCSANAMPVIRAQHRSARSTAHRPPCSRGWSTVTDATSVGDRVAGARIERVRGARGAVVEVAAVVARGGHRQAVQRDHRRLAAVRAGHAFELDPPGLAVRLDAGAAQFAADFDQVVRARRPLPACAPAGRPRSLWRPTDRSSCTPPGCSRRRVCAGSKLRAVRRRARASTARDRSSARAHRNRAGRSGARRRSPTG